MGKKYITDRSKLVAEMSRFVAYVQYKNKKDFCVEDNFVSFGDSQKFLGHEEYYKTEVALNAHDALQLDKWDERQIGNGKISYYASEAIKAAGKKKNNLVDPHQMTHFRDVLYLNQGEVNYNAEKTLYDIYCGSDDEAAFSQAVNVFGGKYDLISFLFFVKDYTKFLPVRSHNFDESFKRLGINSEALSGNCTWGNYIGFISAISEIQKELREFLPATDVRLIDAHSFVWIIHEQAYIDWDPNKEIAARIEQTAERYTQQLIEGFGGKRESTYEGYIRSQKVVDETKRRAHGICQLCGNPAPFKDKNGIGYLEAHHVDWLSRGGKDSTDNTVALCPNCHTKMHVVDDPADVQLLKDVIAKMMQ